ncbi:hypothetical protein C2S53_011145 [Perilla frutescens var. hirtella]|uniref:H15 domain-containing protein n=1 Tax=Perilla frutescens var. hirtella TaxID=608512 RepID=A0AAD4NZ67_PERFH|nr:hypothetical protein C2S53_011145 [Perilla frutescens var. hirtella]
MFDSSTHKTLLHNHNKPMKNLQDFVFKVAEAHINAPLPPPAETLLRDRLHRFVSHYVTPEHPPYSAMIINALQELNEKGGSSEESISWYLERKYDNLPWAHSVLLKHHLEKTCESDDIVETRTKKYRLAGSLNSSTKSKSKPPPRKWRWECKRRKHNQLKIRFRKKTNQRRGERVEANKNHQDCDEKEQCLTENGVQDEDKQDQMKSLLSCADGENFFCSDPTILPAEHGQPELSTPERPPGFESVKVENLPELGYTESEQASAGEVIGSTLMLRQLKCRSRRYSEPRAVTVTSSELVTKSKRQRMLLKQKPNAAAVEILNIVGDCIEQDLKKLGKEAECTSMHEKRPKRRSARLLNTKKKHC